MGRRFLILIFISVLSVLKCYSQVLDQDDILRLIISKDGQATVIISSDNVKSAEILTTNVSVLSVRDKVVYISLSPLTTEWFIQQKYDYRILEKVASKGIYSAQNVNDAMKWDSYPAYSQYDSIMQSFATLYPSLCQLDTIGTSINGKLVLALKISDNPDIEEDEPKVFYTSTIHGDETGGFVLMLHLTDYLLKNYASNNRVKNLVDNLEIWINPLANPDGTYRDGNTITNPIRYNANGYDLNRNFPDQFTPNTVKQKETLDMVKFMRKHKFSLSANFHSGVEVVNYPWDRWLSKTHADDAWFYNISRSYADTAHVYGGPEYMNFLDNGVTRGAEWYIVYGGRQDFITSELQGREVTIELDDQYITPAAQLTLLWQNNWHSLLGYLENALYGIHGLVQNVNTHIPVRAKVFITGHDKDSSQVYADTLAGRFVRFLSPGSWNLTFTATGYQPLLINNVIITSGQATDLTVDMLPLANAVETLKTSVMILLFPNPAGNEISAILPDIVEGYVNVRIFNQTGIMMSDYNTGVVHGIPLKIDLQSFSSGSYYVVFSGIKSETIFYGRFVVIK